MMPAGRYFVGDLSFVLENEWSEISRLSILSTCADGGEFILSSGKTIAVYEVPDNGTYTSNTNSKFRIESSTIGCCSLKQIQNDHKFEIGHLQRIGSIIDFTEPFTTYISDGTITIGHLKIGVLKRYK